MWTTASGTYRIDPGCYLVLNHGREYSLTIETRKPRESFCPFFAAGFVGDVQRALTAPLSAVLDAGPGGSGRREDPFFSEHVRPADHWVTPQLRRMREGARRGLASGAWLKDQFHILAESLLLAQAAVRRQIANIPAVRSATKEELHRRLCRGRDYLHARFPDPPLSAPSPGKRASPLTIFTVSSARSLAERPTPYLVGPRIDRARTLLKVTDQSVSEICLEVGFESLGSFSALFRRVVGIPPARFRRLARRNSQDSRSGVRQGRATLTAWQAPYR